MSDFWSWVLLIVFCIAIVFESFVLVWSIKGWRDAKRKLAAINADDAEESDQLLYYSRALTAIEKWKEAREGLRRFEVQITDWAEQDDAYDDSPMRFRWSIWDADRDYKVLVLGQSPEADGLLMLGNAPTRDQAYDEAMEWLTTQGTPMRLIEKAVPPPAEVYARAFKAGRKYEKDLWHWTAGPTVRAVNGLTEHPEEPPNPYGAP